MTGNHLLSADGENDRLFGCADLPHGNTFTLVFGKGGGALCAGNAVALLVFGPVMP